MRRMTSMSLEQIELERVRQMAKETDRSVTETIEVLIRLGWEIYESTMVEDRDEGKRQSEHETERVAREMEQRREYYREAHEFEDGRKRSRGRPKKDEE